MFSRQGEGLNLVGQITEVAVAESDSSKIFALYSMRTFREKATIEHASNCTFSSQVGTSAKVRQLVSEETRHNGRDNSTMRAL